MGTNSSRYSSHHTSAKCLCVLHGFFLYVMTHCCLQFNGINLRNANEQQARLVIGQQCDTVTILAQYNPHMFQLGNHSRSG